MAHTMEAPSGKTVHVNDQRITAREDTYLAHFDMTADEYREACRRALMAAQHEGRI